MTTLDLRPSEIDLTDIEFWARPLEQRLAAFATLRREAPFSFYDEPELPFIEKGAGYYAIVRHADLVEMSSQPSLFCSGKGAVSIVDLPEDLQEFYGSLISMDSPRHAKIRRIVSKAFTPKVLENLVNSVEEIADQILADVRAGVGADGKEFDLVANISAALPLLIICNMMGVPEDKREIVFDNTNLILSGGDPEFVGSEEEALGKFLEAGAALSGLMTELAASRVGERGDDLLGALLQETSDGEQLTHQEIASFFILLCVAGNETTRNAISHGVYALSVFPEQKAAWMADPGLSKTAVEEIVRWASPVNWMRRTATQDVVVNGQQFHEGDKVVLFYGSANRDPEVFENPDAFDVRRDPNPHVGFGAKGPHFCLGSNLARREIEVMFRKLFTQMPDLEVVGEPDRLQSSFINGIKRLPVRLTGLA